MESLKVCFQESLFGKLTKPMKAHLQNVYAALSLACLSCTIGSLNHHLNDFLRGGVLAIIALTCIQLLIVVSLVMIVPTTKNWALRLIMMLVGCYIAGINMSPLLGYAITIEPTILPTAFFASSLLFISFTISALVVKERKFLALGGFIFAGMFWITFCLVLNVFVGSEVIFEVYPYIALLLAWLFVLYDTHRVLEKFRNGDDDYIIHCLVLFVDFISMFRYFVMLLTDKQKRKDERK